MTKTLVTSAAVLTQTERERLEAETGSELRQYIREASALMGAARSVLDVMSMRFPDAKLKTDYDTLQGMMSEIDGLMTTIGQAVDGDRPLLDEDLQRQYEDGLISRNEARKMQIERAKMRD